MIKNYTVFSAHRQPVKTTATLPDGAQVEAMVATLEVQMVPDDERSGTIKLVFMGAEMAPAEAEFMPGKIFKASFTGV